MSVTVSGTNGLTFNDGSSQQTAASGFGFKNRIINGAMMIDQRNAGASVTPVNQQYSVDRWICALTQSSKYSIQQNAGSVTPPAGFTNYLGITSLSAYSITSTDTFAFQQRLEGLNISDFGWGTANAQPVTLSFWVRSSLTGTFGGSLGNAAFNRTYPFTYAISSANTWEQKSITISGDTSGAWLTTNGIGMFLTFGIGVGSSNSGPAGSWASAGYYSATGATSVVGTSGATFYITGVQLEKGSTATSFDYRPYGTELALCQRYYYKFNSLISGYNSTTTPYSPVIYFKTPMRAAPTMDAGAAFIVSTGSAGTPTSFSAGTEAIGVYNAAANWTTNVIISLTAGFNSEL